MDNDPPAPSELDPWTYRIYEVEAQVRRLQRRVDALSEKKEASNDAKNSRTKPAGVWRTLTTEDRAAELHEFASWVDWLQVRYAAAGDWLRPCWWRHGFVVEELSALRTAWLGVFEAGENPDATAALDWHEAAEKCRERIRQVISIGPGCTAIAHREDQPVVGEPRWIEERAAMGGSDPETSTQSVEKTSSTSEPSVEE